MSSDPNLPLFRLITVWKYLDEDPRTNRIDDSLQLFTAICTSELLKKAHLVLLLNKVRVLFFSSDPETEHKLKID